MLLTALCLCLFFFQKKYIHEKYQKGENETKNLHVSQAQGTSPS